MSNAFVTPCTESCQAPLSMGFPSQEFWSGLPFAPPGDLPDSGMEPSSPALAGRFCTTESLGFLCYNWKRSYMPQWRSGILSAAAKTWDSQTNEWINTEIKREREAEDLPLFMTSPWRPHHIASAVFFIKVSTKVCSSRRGAMDSASWEGAEQQGFRRPCGIRNISVAIFDSR